MDCSWAESTPSAAVTVWEVERLAVERLEKEAGVEGCDKGEHGDAASGALEGYGLGSVG